jgi:hypothetical protein
LRRLRREEFSRAACRTPDDAAKAHPADYASAAISAAVSFILPAETSCSRCETEDAPGIGSIIKVRVLRYAPAVGDKSAMHSHPEAVVVVLKGGRVRYTFPDGTQKVIELKTGDAMIRPPVTHLDEAIDPVESVLVEIKH